MTTICAVSAAVTRELYAAAAEKGIAFVDAPISGGQAGAENGALSIMCGGDEAAYDRAEPVMNAYAKICRRIGESGSGQMTKMCNQIAIAGLVQGFAVDWMRKDLDICLRTANETGASLPVTALVDQFYKDVQKLGGGRWDTSSLIKRLRALG